MHRHRLTAWVVVAMIGLTACAAPDGPRIRYHPGPIPPGAEADSAARAAIDSALDRDPTLRSESVRASVYQSQATLVGFVPTPQLKERAGAIAAGVTGVSGVNNSVFVMGSLPTDSRRLGRIENRLTVFETRLQRAPHDARARHHHPSHRTR